MYRKEYRESMSINKIAEKHGIKPYTVYKTLWEGHEISTTEYLRNTLIPIIQSDRPFRCKSGEMSGRTYNDDYCPCSFKIKTKKKDDFENEYNIDYGIESPSGDIYVTETMVLMREEYLKEVELDERRRKGKYA